MIGLLHKHMVWVQRGCIALLLAWSVATFVFLWLSGERETQGALATGKRFIVHVEDGRVEGLAAAAPEAEKAAEPEAVIPPPESAPVVADASAVTSVQASSSPIADISEDMIDKANGAPLPKISPSGIKPWQYYAKSFRRQNEMPLIAIVVTGLGQSKKTTEMSFGLDDRIGLSFSPYAASVGSWAAASRLTGHETFVDLPFQTAAYPVDDPGSFSIMVTRSNAQNIKNLYWTMSRFQGYAGLVAPMGEVVTSSADSIKPLSDEIAKRGLMLLLGRDTLPHDEKRQGNKELLVSMSADVWIDEELSEMTIQARLATLEQVAQRNGMAIGIAQAYPISLKEIKQWQETLGERGIVLAPATFITKLKHD